MSERDLEKLLAIFKLYNKIKLVYLFGSRATNKIGPLSDYDFALYLDEKDRKKISEIKLDVLDKMARVLKSDKIDLVILNIIESPELKYNIIKEGRLIFKKDPFKVLVEPRILTEYFDFHTLLLKYNLTKA